MESFSTRMGSFLTHLKGIKILSGFLFSAHPKSYMLGRWFSPCKPHIVPIYLSFASYCTEIDFISLSVPFLQKKKGVFQHSSFLAGGATSAAGRLVVEKGLLKAWILTALLRKFSPFTIRLQLINEVVLYCLWTGCLATQWALSTNRRKLSGIHDLS